MKWLIGIIGVLSVLLVLTAQKACTSHPGQTDTVIVVEQHYDSAEHTITSTPKDLNHPVLIETIRTVTDSFFKDVDTAAIISQWLLTSNYYRQHYRDTAIDLLIDDTIRRNEIASRTITYKVIRPCIDSVKTVMIKQRQKVRWYLGADFAFGYYSGIAPKAMIIDKRNTAYSISTNVFQSQPNATVGVAFKIK